MQHFKALSYYVYLTPAAEKDLLNGKKIYDHLGPGMGRPGQLRRSGIRLVFAVTNPTSFARYVTLDDNGEVEDRGDTRTLRTKQEQRPADLRYS